MPNKVINDTNYCNIWTDTTREKKFKRKLINYTKNELQGINILKLRLPNGLKCCLNFFYCRNG